LWDIDNNSNCHAHTEEKHGDIKNTWLNSPSWDAKEYLPQGTVGAVVFDNEGTFCVATSTGRIANKLPGRIGDMPTLRAGESINKSSSNGVGLGILK